MTGWPRTLAHAAGMVALAALNGSPVTARPFVVDDLLKVQSFGAVLVAPGERWLVLEKRRPWDEAVAFDFETQMDIARSDLLVVDLDRPGEAKPLIASRRDRGHVALAFAPDGAHLAVARLQAHRWELGLTDMATGTTRWLGITPGLALDGRSVQWRNATEFVVLAHRHGDMPAALREGRQASERLPLHWAATASGEKAAATAIGSGRFRDVRGRAPDRELLLVQTGGRIDRLASGEFVDFELSPDGSRIAVLAEGDEVQQAPQDMVGVGTQSRRRTLLMVDLDHRDMRSVCQACDVATGLLTWSPSAKALLIFARKARDDWRSGKLYRIDRSGGAHPLDLGELQPELFGAPDFPPYVAADWMGDTPIVLARTASDARADWHLLDGHVSRNLTQGLPCAGASVVGAYRWGLTASCDGQAWMVHAQGEAEAVLEGGWEPLPRVNQKGMRGKVNARESEMPVAFWARGSAIQIARWPTDRAPLRFDMPAEAVPRAWLPGRESAVFETLDDHKRASLMVSRRGMAPVRLASINAHLGAVEGAHAVPIERLSGEDKRLVDWLYLPARPRAGPPPLVVIIYPGKMFSDRRPTGQGVELDRFHANAELLAGEGYAVLLPSLPARPRGEPARDLARDTLAAVDNAAGRGLFDPERLALWGHSFGGYGAAVIATQTDRFKAIIASAGLYDLASMRGTFLPSLRIAPEDGISVNAMSGWAENGQARLGTTPWADPMLYARNSPIFLADRIMTPMLLLHGERDIAPLSQAEEMFSALYRQNKDAMLVTYWGEGHVVTSPANVRDFYSRVFGFLNRTMGDAPAGGARD
ncbi:S9 family peptidase [Sphingomonas sp. DBB INV C78]|uniref:alpha/beta hydrolase family protein n=1 Tax=Sphingomonas sp. DBB INV C78 TaxID=3349434 RepID=UPI0036D2E44C